MYLLCFNVPESHLEKVKNAVFEAGAGKLRNYSHCSSQNEVLGQFQPLEGSNPFAGEIGKIEIVKEYKVETLCEKEYIKAVIAALKIAHPYEVPSYQVLALEEF